MLFLVAVWPLVCGTNMGSLIAKVAVAPVAIVVSGVGDEDKDGFHIVMVMVFLSSLKWATA